MKKAIYRAEKRGFTHHNWLKSYHTFNFANYYEDGRSGFGKLVVINEDTVQPGKGYGTRRHDNVEIISMPLSGEIAHKDDFGNETLIHEGMVQVISAGKGLTHSEFNPSETKPLHFLEIWILPNRIDGEPHYQVQKFKPREDHWFPVLHPEKVDGTLSIYQDACLCLGRFGKNAAPAYNQRRPGCGIFVMILKGRIMILDDELHPYDAIGLKDSTLIKMQCLEDSDILVIEIPMENSDS